MFKHVGLIFASVVLGFFLMTLLGLLFDKLGWPLFNSWALVHQSFLSTWFLLALISFVSLELLMYFRQRARD